MDPSSSRPLQFKKIEPWLIALAAAIVLRLLLVRVDPRVVPPQWDEFIFLTNAKRLFLGLVPYRDYQWFVPPVGEAIYAALFWLDGEASAALARSSAHLLATWTALTWYLTGRRLSLHPLVALLPGGAFLGLFFPVWSIPLHHWTAQWLASLTVWVAVLAWTSGSSRRGQVLAGLAGALWVLTGLTVQTQGLLLAVLLLGLWHAHRNRDPLAPIGLHGFVLGAAAVVVGFGIWLVATGTLGTFVDASVLYPFKHYHQEGGVNDVGWLADLPLRLTRMWGLRAPLSVRLSLCAAELAALLAALGAVVMSLFVVGHWLVRRIGGQRTPGPLILLTVTLGLVLWAVRPDVMHLAFYAPLVIAALCLHLGDDKKLPRRGRSLFFFALGICVLVGNSVHLLSPSLQGAPVPPLRARWDGPEPSLAGLPWVDAMMIAMDPGLLALRKVALVHPDAQLFALPEGAVAYFLVMPPAVPDALLLPPQARYDGPVEYARTLRALQRRPAELLMLRPEREGLKFINPPDWASAESRDLAFFLRQRYRPWMRVAASMIYLRSDLSADDVVAQHPASAPAP